MNFYELYTAVTLGFLTSQAVTFFVAHWYFRTKFTDMILNLEQEAVRCSN